jgi:NadR type nicotinamide-nucleotide adenylyltransferase
MKKTGLTLGKYAPFHKGHQLVFDTALSEVDELIVLIYDTTVTEVPLQIRANWIRTLYPQVTVIECWDGPDGYSTERAFEIVQEQYILSKLDTRKITHFYSSEFYGDHVSKALGAIDRRIDSSRTRVPISATAIRENPYASRQFLHETVYRDLITKIVFVGAMSTGKTTITEACAKKYKTTLALEYGREYWENHQIDRRISFEAFNEIAVEHLRREEIALRDANKYFFVDTNAITTFMYALDYHGKAPDLLKSLAIENYKRYDLFFLCNDDIPYDDTWDRSGPQKRAVFHKQIIADLKERNIPYIILNGSLEERLSKVESVLTRFTKYNNFFGNQLTAN